MRVRHALATAAAGTALALGGLAAPSQAATSDTHVAATAATASDRTQHSEGEVGVQASYHFWASYWTLPDCTAAGVQVVQSNPSRYLRAKCEPGYGTDGKRKFHLYVLF